MKYRHQHDSVSHHCCGKCPSGHCHHDKPAQEKLAFLQHMAQTPRLPVVRFLLRSTKSEHLSSAALEPVYLFDAQDSMAQVKENGFLLTALLEKGWITLDYEAPLADADYRIYHQSAVYQLFLETVAHAKNQPHFLYDSGFMECGSMALTDAGITYADTFSKKTTA